MPSIKYISIDQYIDLNGSDPILKERMLEYHNFILKVMKKYDLTPTIGYNMPVYTYKGRPAIYWGFFKNHISLNFPPYGLYQHFEKDLKDYTLTKSACHLLHDKPIDYKLMEKMFNYRIEEMEKYERKKFKK